MKRKKNDFIKIFTASKDLSLSLTDIDLTFHCSFSSVQEILKKT